MTIDQERTFLRKIVERGPELIRLDAAAKVSFKKNTNSSDVEIFETELGLNNAVAAEQIGHINSATAVKLIKHHLDVIESKSLELEEQFNQRSAEVDQFDAEIAAIESAMLRLKELNS